MGDAKKHDQPYQTLGSRLKRLREKMQESLAEVSGAVEIETHTLERFETGASRPSEDILQLLISHFDMDESEADKLWRLAGYDRPDTSQPADDQTASSVVVMPFDVRIAYTDMAHTTVNNYGVVIDFMQSAGPNSQPLVVSRLGMSREHAESLVELLQKALKPQEPKALPEPSNDDTSKQQKKTD